RIEPAAVRSGGIRTGTCRGLAYRIQLDEVPDVHDGRIRKHDCGRVAGHYSFSRGLEWSDVWTASPSDGSAGHLVRPHGLGADLLLSVVEIHDSEVPIRSTHEVRLEGADSTRAGEHSRHQLHRGCFMIQILFFFFAAVAVGAAINVLVQKHVLYSALSLILM